MFKSATVDRASAKSSNSAPFHRETEQDAFIQPKLNIGKPNDKYEKEADHVADKVVNKTNVYGESPFFSPLTTIQKRNIQKQEDKESVQEKPIAETITPLVQLEPSEEEETIQEKCHTCENNDTIQKQDNEEEENVQAKTNTNTPKNPIANLGSRIQQNRGRGKPLDKPILTKMQQGFGVDFSGVKIHTNSQSVAMNRDLGARAFTNKNDIFFNEGEFNPQSKDGQTLLAHELTHTIQQGASARMKTDVQKRENVVDMAELIKQIIQSSKEQKDALDPTKANETRKDAAAKGVEAEAQANSKIPEVEPSEPDLPETDVDTDASRIATPIPKEPDVVVPSSQKKQDTSSASQNTAQNPAQESTSVDNETQAASNVSTNKVSDVHAETTAPKPAINANNQKEEGGETLQYLEQESADVCNKGAQKAQKLADNESAHDTAEAKANQTEVAVVPPENEGQSRGNADQVKTLEKAQAPESNEQAIKREMDKAISDAVPKKIKELNEFESGKKAQVIGNKVLASTAKQVGEVKGTYNEIDKKAEAHESDVPVAIPSIEQSPNTPALNLGKGAVPSVPQEQTDLSNFEEEADNIYEKEGISKDMQAEFENVDSGDIAEANKEKSVLKDKVANEPANLQDFAKQKQNKVETDLQAEEAEAKSSMEAKRQKELESAKSTQVKTKTDMEKKREAVTQWINNRYTKAKDFVTEKLNKLETQALNTFDAGQKLHAIRFEQNVKRRVNAWKSDRYSGFWGAAKWVKDKFVGIDHFPEIKTIFTTERATFVKAIDVLILNINKENEKTIQQCKEEIVNAKTDIQEFIDKLGPDLIDVGKKAQEDTAKKLAKLDKHIDQEKKKLQQKLCDKKDEAIKAIDKKIEAMKAEMSGLVSKLGGLLLYAAKKFFKWAISKIGGSADKIISALDKGATVLKKLFTDPIGFFKNLVKAVGGGIKGFVTNIVSWLKKGLVSWLMGQMGDSGLELPKKFDMKGIIFLGLQVAGLTWNVIRARIVKNLGPKGETIMSAAEKTADIIKRVVIEGPIALWNIIVEKAGEIKTKVMEGIRNWAITQIIKKMSFKLMSMLNPAGAILQAIMLLYDVVMFFIENWNRIVDFVKSVFDSVGEIASGALGKASQFIENTLGKTVPIILSFAARFVGLSGIGKAIRKVIKAIQKPFKKILDKMIKFLVKKVKKLFKFGKAKVKGAVASVLQWWKLKKKFKGKDGKEHSLYIRGNGKKAKLMVASNPTNVGVLLKHKLKTADNTKKISIQSAIEKADKVNSIIESLSKEKDEKKSTNLNNKLKTQTTAMKTMLSTIMDVDDHKIKVFLDKWLGKKVKTSKQALNKNFVKAANKVGYNFFESENEKQIRRSSKENLPKLTINEGVLMEGVESSEKPTHNNFIPDAITITEQNGKYIATYTTKSSDGKKTAEFKIELSFDAVVDDLPDATQVRKVKGEGLSSKTKDVGRGKWDSAVGGFDNAHIIGDQFGGSGKNFGMNIHPSSPGYNREKMASVENKMASEFKTKGGQYDLEATAYLKDDIDSDSNLKRLLVKEFKKDNPKNGAVPKEIKATAENKLIQSLQKNISADVKALPAQFIRVAYHSKSISSHFGDDNFDSASKTITLGQDSDYESLKDRFKTEQVASGTTKSKV
ncbi:eCIS core domain-containing protein [Hwangdonia lutea]|uniref:DUF4157 domain-containing protein n=1 Tax=Hwangdonia lutea TaxID=3075823 RepID=A0AA97EKK5_9FLAO|nr:DUF4157 domain-containing protein [Hwangdonia sp. SCSIO 19198]WOD42847.1 DUF4157 domain-containing protein [Hwangdonia sp. SCSIO 19198]